MVEKVEARFELVDDRFAGVGGDAWMERLFSDGRWTEGPAYVPAARSLVFSDNPNDRVLRWDETTGAVGVFTYPAGYANGRTLDRQGRLITCEHGNRRVTRTEHDGSTTVIADRYDGRRLNSPNDVVERADGSIWFTDPSYGIDSDYEGYRADPEIDGCHVYRVDPSGEVTIVADDFIRPNGLAFSADEKTIFIVDTRRKHIRRFAVRDDSTLAGGDELATCNAGSFDGVRLDADDRLWVSAGDGLHCFSSDDGTLLGKLLVPEPTSNLTFGGLRRNHLFITATTSVYALRVNINGCAYPR